MFARLILTALAFGIAATFVAAEPTVFLVRHAEKAQGGVADPKDPELSAAGRARAESLAKMFRDAGIVALFASEYKRTQQTAEEIGRAVDAQVTIVPAKETVALVDKLRGVDGNAVVVGHSNTLPEIIKALGVTREVQIAETDYDNLFIWNRSAPGELVRLHQQPTR